MKWLCGRCGAINASGATKCHQCQGVPMDNWVKGRVVSCVRCGKEYLQTHDDNGRCSLCDVLGQTVTLVEHQLALAKIKALESEIDRLKHPYKENL